MGLFYLITCIKNDNDDDDDDRIIIRMQLPDFNKRMVIHGDWRIVPLVHPWFPLWMIMTMIIFLVPSLHD